MKQSKAMTIRLSAEQAESLETVASIDDLSISEVIRAAIGEHISSRQVDSQFQAGLHERIKRAEQMLEGSQKRK